MSLATQICPPDAFFQILHGWHRIRKVDNNVEQFLDPQVCKRFVDPILEQCAPRGDAGLFAWV